MAQTGDIGFIDLHRSDAVRILDFPHAAEHLNQLIEVLQQAGVALPVDAFDRSLHLLKHRGPGLLLRWYDHLPAPLRELESVQKQGQYFRKRLSLMGVTRIPTRWVAYWLRHGRKCQQSGGTSSARMELACIGSQHM